MKDYNKSEKVPLEYFWFSRVHTLLDNRSEVGPILEYSGAKSNPCRKQNNPYCPYDFHKYDLHSM